MINTPKDLRGAFEKITRATHDVDDTYQMLMDALMILLTELNPKSNETLDQSQTAMPGNTYLTPYNLPIDWGLTQKIVVDIIPYYPVPFKQRIGYRFSARHYYIDVKNKQFYLTGAVASAKTINHWYQPFPNNVMTAANELLDMEANNMIGFPKRFWRVLAFEAAFLYLGGIDGEDVARVISQAQMNQYYRLRDALNRWDGDQKLQELGGALGYADQDDRPFDVGLL
jgi:hypothetical protein